ncbi:MAG: phosphoribosylformylglycinamidine synthase I [Candidatus Omnitrophica bacterium]|nr:phosphoribosylformylglycinamidine synthase I [Candidatus Omnitrophota bacterium]MDD5653108.1 phosphoribosylformylglycinamidine synthase I [Candidatus Omnitrophota bacterium]
MRKVRVCILRTAGTNCDKETAFAFKTAGAETELVHVNRLIGWEKQLEDYQILAFPGGFSYGDDIAAGKILANELKCKLANQIKDFVSQGKLIIGICNGFQILVKAGLLPGNKDFTQEASLITNDSGKFEDRWTYLRAVKTKCIWTKNLPQVIYLPVAHGEGKFVVKEKSVLERLKKNQQIVFQYCDKQGDLSGYPDNPNGAIDNIAGICDATGRILGLMPHPERHQLNVQHPCWSAAGKNKKSGDGLQIFQNGVDYAKKLL